MPVEPVPSPTGCGRLVLAGVPLGNPADASARLGQILAEADIVAAEDTRRLSRLARDLGLTVTGRVVSYFEANEARRTAELVEAGRAGATVVLVTDGGMPSISDPGFRLVRAAIEAGLPVDVVPGPTAVTTALAVSGLPCDRFCFEGFLPRRPAARRAALAVLAGERRTLVLFEAPHRIGATLADLVEAFGPDRPAALCRELTKTHQQVVRAGLAELSASVAAQPPRGEITLVVGGAPEPVAPDPPDPAEIQQAVAHLVAAGASRRDAVEAVASRYQIPRRQVYRLSVAG